MKKSYLNKTYTIVVILALFSVSVVPSTGRDVEQSSISPLCDGKTLYVGGSGPNNYTRIQDAIDNASDGDTVFVYNGTYIENLVVNMSINLIGENRNITVIDGNKSENVVSINADWVNINGFTIQNSEDYLIYEGIECFGNYTNISNNFFFDNYNGIYFNGDNNIISNNNFSRGNGTPIYFDGANNIISENIIYGSGEGMVQWWGEIRSYYGCTHSIIANNTIIDSNSSILHGISLNGGIRDNLIIGNDINGYVSGLYISGGLRNTISKNNLQYNGWGIFSTNCGKTNISRNILHNNNCGIGLYSCFRNNISKNSVINSSKIGIILSEFSILNKIYYNNFIKNKHNAYFALFSPCNKWNSNFWDKPRNRPYPIMGSIFLFIPSGINFDWNPAQEPYDFGV